ncbi:MAG: hypothetical protein ACRCW6_01270 [Mycoplasmoidaceae bacterium]
MNYLGYIFFSTAVALGLIYIFLVIYYYFAKKREIELKKRFNLAKSVDFDCRQKLIVALAEHDPQIDPICGYSLTFKEQYQLSLSIIEKDIYILSGLNRRFNFSKANKAQKIINQNFEIIENALYKHDLIVYDASKSFFIVSKIAVFHQKIIKNIIRNFEDRLSIDHHGAKVNKLIYEISQILIIIEENKMKNDINVICNAFDNINIATKKLINYLKTVNLILIAKVYLKNKIDSMDLLLLKEQNNIHSRRDLHEIEKLFLKLKNYYQELNDEQVDFDVDNKKKLINDSLSILKKINQSINYNLSTNYFQENAIKVLRNWIGFIKLNADSIDKVFDLIIKTVECDNKNISQYFEDKISKINFVRKKLINDEYILEDEKGFQKCGIIDYVNKIRIIISNIIIFNKLVDRLNQKFTNISNTYYLMITSINSYKIVLVNIQSKIVNLKNAYRIPYDPIELLSELDDLENQVVHALNDVEKEDHLNDKIVEISYKIIEINAIIHNDEKMISYMKKLAIHFNQFYDKTEYNEFMKNAFDFYNNNKYFEAVNYLLKKYNWLEKKYSTKRI